VFAFARARTGRAWWSPARPSALLGVAAQRDPRDEKETAAHTIFKAGGFPLSVPPA